jgi:hypothetical protein
MTFLITIVVSLIYLVMTAGFFRLAIMDPVFKDFSLTFRILSVLIWPAQLFGWGCFTWRKSYEDIRKELGK